MRRRRSRRTPSRIRSRSRASANAPGAHGITAHLRADRRHMLDRDLERLRDNVMTKLNLEMGNTPEIVDFAIRIVPDEVCLVPETRQEITTEGGLDLIAHRRELASTVKRLQAAGFASACSSIRCASRSMRRWI
jgi:pyridoxine 5-phosphate synthase